jgi:hypothetical protein
MKTHGRCLVVLLLLAMGCPVATAEQFTVFPDRKELRSPDGRFVIRSVDQSSRPGELTGIFHTLVIEEPATGSVRKLYDYVGRVAVAWSRSDFIIVTDYVNKKTSRVLVFPMNANREVLVVDKVQMSSLIPETQSIHLQQNDHVFVEVSSVEGTALTLRVWGYGRRDATGFRLQCRYDLAGGTVACK